MAIKQLYFTDQVPAGGTNFLPLLSESSPAAAAFSPVTGWIADEVITATSYAELRNQVEVAKTYTVDTWSTTTQYPVASTLPNSAQGDAFCTALSYNGTFAATSWTIALLVRSVTSQYTGRFRLRWRVYKSNTQEVNVGTPVWSELTSAVQLTPATTAALSTTTPLLMSATWSPGTTITLTNEYLLFALGIEVTTTPTGTTNTQDINLFEGPTGLVTTPDFTAAGGGAAASFLLRPDSVQRVLMRR